MIPKLFLIPLLAGIVVQLSKFIWQSSAGTFNWRVMNIYGGMPSAHTAIAVSLITVIGLEEGLSSAPFAVAAIYGLLVIRDAIGFRRHIGKHSKALNRMVRDHANEDEEHVQEFREQLGHTPLEAFVGGVLGFAISVVFFLLFP